MEQRDRTLLPRDPAKEPMGLVLNPCGKGATDWTLRRRSASKALRCRWGCRAGLSGCPRNSPAANASMRPSPKLPTRSALANRPKVGGKGQPPGVSDPCEGNMPSDAKAFIEPISGGRLARRRPRRFPPHRSRFPRCVPDTSCSSPLLPLLPTSGAAVARNLSRGATVEPAVRQAAVAGVGDGTAAPAVGVTRLVATATR